MKAYLHLPPREPPDDDEDAQIALFISAARAHAEIAQHRDLVMRQLDLSLDYWPTWEIRLREPLVSVDLVQYRDSSGATYTLTLNTDYMVDTAKHPGLIRPMYNKTWPYFTPWPSSAVLVRVTSGMQPDDPFWSSEGAVVKKGMLMLISAWFNNRLPFEKGVSAADEYPYAVTMALSHGARVMVA